MSGPTPIAETARSQELAATRYRLAQAEAGRAYWWVGTVAKERAQLKQLLEEA